jgi:uncharacterized Zn finger protein (UPF0148 family)
MEEETVFVAQNCPSCAELVTHTQITGLVGCPCCERRFVWAARVDLKPGMAPEPKDGRFDAVNSWIAELVERG